MHKIGDLTLRQCWYIILTILIPFVCVGGSTYFPNHFRFPLIVVITVMSFIISIATTKKLTLNLISVLWLAVSMLICITSLVSFDRENTLEFGVLYLLSSLMLFVEFPDKIWDKIIFVINIFVIVVAVSIIASVFVDNLMTNQFWFIVNPIRMPELDQEIHAELRIGAYSGLAGEKAEAALIMNVGIAVILSKFFSGVKCKAGDAIELLLVVIALILTGKRMQFLIPIFVFVIMMLMSNIKHKFVKFLVICIMSVCCVIVASLFIPEMQTLYNRFIGNINSQYFDVLSGRSDLWKYSFMMFAENPIFGMGFASFNAYSFAHGYLYKGEEWRYYGHNCYYELLGEVGIIGTVLILGLLLSVLVITIKYLKSYNLEQSKKRLLMFSFYNQVMFLIYCTSGNVLYQQEQIFLWFISMSMVLSVYRENKRENSNNITARLSRYGNV